MQTFTISLDMDYINGLINKFDLTFEFFTECTKLVATSERIREIGDAINADYFSETIVLTGFAKVCWEANNLKEKIEDNKRYAKENEEREAQQKERDAKYQKDKEERDSRYKQAYDDDDQAYFRRTSPTGFDPYKVLGVSRDSSKDMIKAAYRKLAMTYHPDINHDSDATEKMAQINRAWEQLR